MNQPEQSSIASNSPGLPLEVTVVSDAETTRRLSRVLALARLRSPYTWGFVLLIPLILMSRRFIEVFIAANSPGWNVSDLFLSYFGLLAVTVVMSLVLTGVQLIKRNASIAAYAAPGTAISARFQQDSLELILTTGTTTIPYSQVKDLFAIGGGVFLREKGTRGLALPRGLFPDVAFELLGRRLPGAVVGDSTSTERNCRRVLAVIGSVGLVAVIVAVSAFVRRGGDDHADWAAGMPNPCLLSDSQMAEFGLNGGDLRDTLPEQRQCAWDKLDRNNSEIFRALLIISPTPYPVPGESQPYRLGTAGNGIDGQKIIVLPESPYYDYLCEVGWKASYGYVYVLTSAEDSKHLDREGVCRRTEKLAGLVFTKFPH
ncbi:hypothetical protein AB0I30_24310 [Nocardia tengchongensis]|uniref:hypothetical protein n=1 Tax=Nocardia tengchongensis TaxID=2055889 RepID=UPI0033E6E078